MIVFSLKQKSPGLWAETNTIVIYYLYLNNLYIYRI
jgi:hypothetical protein